MKLRVFVAILLLSASTAFAGDLPVVLEPNQAVVQVNGVVCSFCAYGAEKSLAELDGLDPAQFGNGVLIDIDTHRITLAMQPGEKIPLREIYQRIKRAGYDPITFYLRSEGTLQRSGDQLLLRDSNSGQVFRVIGGETPGAADDASVRVQASLVASQIPELGENDVLEVTIDRVVSD